MSTSSSEMKSSMAEAEEEESFMMAMELACGSILPMVLKCAIELDLFETMAKAGPAVYISPSELAAQLPTHNSHAPLMLDRLLRLLAASSVLNCTLRHLPDGGVERLYGLAPVCKFFTRNAHGVSLAPLSLIVQDKVFMESWYYLKDVVLNGGIPFNKAYGMTSFEYQSVDPRFNKAFNHGMSNHSAITTSKILDVYKGFEGLSSIVDVGGGIGATLNMIVCRYPSIKGINFDLPCVIEDSPSYPGVEHIGGDMFVSVPQGEAIFMKWVCHDWSDEHCKKLLKNCYEALPENGKLIVADLVLPEVPDAKLSTKMTVNVDILMLAQNPGGKERTKKEYETLAKGAGFEGFQVICCAFNTWIMEFLKKN